MGYIANQQVSGYKSLIIIQIVKIEMESKQGFW